MPKIIVPMPALTCLRMLQVIRLLILATVLEVPAVAATVSPSARTDTTSNWLQDWTNATVSDGTYLLPAASAGDEALIDDGRSIVVDSAITVDPGTITVGAASTLEIQGGSLTNGGSGPRTVFTDTNGSGGAVLISGGTFTATGAAPTDALFVQADSITISGGTFDMSGGQVILADTTALTVVGDEAGIQMDRLNVNSPTRAATIRFVFDENGISCIDSSAFINLSEATLIIDGSAYTGVAASFDLFSSPNIASVASDVTVIGLGEEGKDYVLTQDTENNIVRIEITDYGAARASVESLGNLISAPAIFTDDTIPGTPAALGPGDLKTLYYDTLDYEGNPTRAYAWVGIPEGASAENPVPAVVLVHGGGGTAFLEWVRKWKERGYAAIAMGLEGQTDELASQAEKDAGLAVGNWLKHDLPGPARAGIYGDTDKPLEDQWMYHAVADVVLANSLVRSLPGVDASKVGLVGISWGGVITSTVIGIDDRYAFAVPTYGCGHKFDIPNQYGAALGDNLLYREVWDPVLCIENVTTPLLWFSWPGENNFSLDSQGYTYHAAVKSERTVSLVPGMGHGHPPMWDRPESYDFADSVIESGASWCVQESISRTDSAVKVVFSSSRPLQSASLVHTSGTGYTGSLTWTETAVDSLVEDPAGTWTVKATLPAGTTGWFVNVRSQASDADADNDGTTDLYGYKDDQLIASSDYREIISVFTVPDTAFAMDHSLEETLSTGMLNMAFTGPTNAEIIDVQITEESHPGSFSVAEALPFVIWSPAPALTPFRIAFDNSVSGLAELETATAVLTIVWEDQLDGSTDQVQVPVSATARNPSTVTFNSDANWSSKEVYSFDDVVIESGAAVTLDQPDTAASLSVQNGSLEMTRGELLSLNTMEVASAGVVNLTSGQLSMGVDLLSIDGELRINGGTVDLPIAGLDPQLTGSGRLIVYGGSFSLRGGGAADLTRLGLLTEISGGTFLIEGQQLLESSGVLRVVGDNPSMDIRLQRLSASSSGTFQFVMDATGVGTVNFDYWINLGSVAVHADGSAYEGGPGEIVLIDSTNLNTPANPSNFSVSGFEGKGLDVEIVQDTSEDCVRLVMTPSAYGLWASGFGLSGLAAHAASDPDSDGLSNLLEFALGGDPAGGPDPGILPQTEVSPSEAGASLDFVFLRRRDAPAKNLSYSVKRSTSLAEGSWSTSGVSETGVVIIDSEFEQVTSSIAAGNPVFGRLEINLSN